MTKYRIRITSEKEVVIKADKHKYVTQSGEALVRFTLKGKLVGDYVLGKIVGFEVVPDLSHNAPVGPITGKT